MEVDNKSTVICRVCLSYDFQKNDGKGVSLFEEYNDCVVSDKINALANVKIKEGDGLPDRICLECLLELENAFKFKLKCERTNEVLLSAVNEAPTFEGKYGDPLDSVLNVKEEYLDDDPTENEDLDDNLAHDLDASVTSYLVIEPSVVAQSSKVIDLNIICHDHGGTFEGNNGSLDDFLNIKEENLYYDDTQNDELDKHPPNLDTSVTSSLEKESSVAAPPKPSRAIDLKLICHDCGGSFKSKCKLRVHWKNVHLTENLKCENCLRRFKTFAALKSHKKRNSKSCQAASKVRIEGEGRNRIFYCKECDYHSKRIQDLRCHTNIHSGERPYQCNLCLKYFTQPGSLHAHKESVHKLYKTVGTCDYCGKSFKGRSKLYRHIQNHNSSNYPCKICKRVLKTKGTLKAHMVRHSGVKAYSCEICSASFYDSSGLWCHKENVHIKSRLYICDICKYKTHSCSLIKKHKKKHTASNVGCNVCGKIVENEYQLKLHQMRHTDRNFPCPHCDKTYYSNKNLYTHIRGKHKMFMLNVSSPKTTKAGKS